jgi:WhiB family redox-sensing transcriptional regulator
MTTSRNWRQLAACRDAPDVDFFAEGAGHAARQETERAKAVCSNRPVREDCLQYALRSGEKFGIWGGLGDRERRRLRHSRHQEGREAA